MTLAWKAGGGQFWAVDMYGHSYHKRLTSFSFRLQYMTNVSINMFYGRRSNIENSCLIR